MQEIDGVWGPSYIAVPNMRKRKEKTTCWRDLLIISRISDKLVEAIC